MTWYAAGTDRSVDRRVAQKTGPDCLSLSVETPNPESEEIPAAPDIPKPCCPSDSAETLKP